MGNGQPKYYSVDDASEIIGKETWIRLRKQLQSTGNKTIDYSMFEKIITTRFERMVGVVACDNNDVFAFIDHPRYILQTVSPYLLFVIFCRTQCSRAC